MLKTPTKEKEAVGDDLDSPVGVSRGSLKYVEFKLAQSEARRKILESTVPELEDVEGLFPFKTVAPTKTKKH